MNLEKRWKLANEFYYATKLFHISDSPKQSKLSLTRKLSQNTELSQINPDLYKTTATKDACIISCHPEENGLGDGAPTFLFYWRSFQNSKRSFFERETDITKYLQKNSNHLLKNFAVMPSRIY